MSDKRVIISGIGLMTPCGYGWEPYWDALLKGVSKIDYLTNQGLNGSAVKLAGELSEFDPKQFIKQRKSLKVMSREIQLAVAASQLAMQDSAIELTDSDRDRFGVSLGTGVTNNDLDEMGVGIRNGLDENGQFQMKKFGAVGVRSLFPLWLLKYLPNMPACHISIALGLRGPSNTVTTSSAAGAHAIGEAFRVIQRGDADMMITGSTDSKINAMGISRFDLLDLLSHRDNDPNKAYRPFDKDHDGIVLGEGAGLLILEEKDHAVARGAKIYAEIVGYGSASDFNYDPRRTTDFTGKTLSMTRAMEDASMGPKEIDAILANGSGIPQEDVQESRAIHAAFESAVSNLKVTGSKAVTGHLVYGSAGVEMAASAIALKEGLTPPLANFEQPDPECDLPFIKNKPDSSGARSLLFNSFGFGGQNASIVVRKV